VVEARVSAQEIEFLGDWFAAKGGWPRFWCERTWQEEVEGDVAASSREMFGSLFLIFASEIIRDQCSEEFVWPAISRAFRTNKNAYSALFDSIGQPAANCKDAMAAAARRLDLRNLIDRYGKQEYFDTLKLQIGFTFRGAKGRLPEWLDGFGQPTAIRILTGELQFTNITLESDGFKELWKTLRQYRRSGVSEADVTSVLESSPWVRPEWISPLIATAKLRLNRGVVSAAEGEAFDSTREPVCEPILRWQYASKPLLYLKLNEEQIYEKLGDRDSATFAIDGQVVDRWTARESGGWNGQRELPCQKEGAARPNLRPQSLAITSGDTSVEEIDLSDLGLTAPLLLFDLGTGQKCDPDSKLDPNRDYGLLCDPSMEVASAQFFKGKNRSAYLLTRPLTGETRVLCAGDPYWEPLLANTQRRRAIRLALESPPGDVVEIETATHIDVKGVPDDASEVSLIIGTTRHPVILAATTWRTQRPVKITLGIAIGNEPIFVRVEGADYKRTVPAKVSLNLLGIAAVQTKGDDADLEWKLLNKYRPLNRAGGTGRARIFAPSGTSKICEGPCLINNRPSRVIDLHDLYAWGDQLVAHQQGTGEAVLAGSVEDHGCVGLFMGTRPKTWNTLHRRTPQVPGKDHEVWVWASLHNLPCVIPGNKIRTDFDGFVWTLPDMEQVTALAVTYQGACLGSYWGSSSISSDLDRPLRAGDFALIRWLKIPVLNPTFRPGLQRAISRAPAEFIQGWLGKADIPRGLIHRPAEQGLETVIRAFLWDHVERNESRLSLLVRAFPRPVATGEIESDADQFKRTLVHIGGICPSVAYGFAKLHMQGEKYRKFTRSVVNELLRQPPCELPQLRAALAQLRYNCANLIGLSQDELLSAADSYGRSLDGQPADRQYDQHLGRLGEMAKGREFLSASLLLKLAAG